MPPVAAFPDSKTRARQEGKLRTLNPLYRNPSLPSVLSGRRSGIWCVQSRFYRVRKYLGFSHSWLRIKCTGNFIIVGEVTIDGEVVDGGGFELVR